MIITYSYDSSSPDSRALLREQFRKDTLAAEARLAAAS